MPLPIPVRHPTWQGHQPVAALWFCARRMSSVQREHRLLAQWIAGSRAWRFPQGDLLVWPSARIQACATLPGTPLCRIDGRLHAAPLTSAERAAIASADLVLVDAACATPHLLTDAQALDPSAWVDVSGYAARALLDLAVPAPPPLPPALRGKSVRDVLGSAAPRPSAEREAFLRELQHGPGTSPAGPLGRLGEFFGRLPAIAAGAIDGAQGRSRTMEGHRHGRGAAQEGLASRHAPGRPSAWRARLARLAMIARLGGVISRRQGAYLRRMMEMFERGDVIEGLRHAVPLDGFGGEAGQAFGTPGRRRTLDVGSARGAGPSIGVADEVQDHLRQMYEAAFQRLDREGRVDEALFVLAELLCERSRSLDYLERHGRHAQAAELALAWDMPAATLIRLLLLGGDTRRAVLVARRDGAFAEAVAQLRGAHPALADALRREWADALVGQGEWLQAVEVAWPLPDVRDKALQWLQQAERAGAELSARALVRRAELLPDTVEEHEASIAALLDPAADPMPREAMLHALLGNSRSGEGTRRLARHLLPVIAADRASGRSGCEGRALDRLLKTSGDAALAADVPDWALPVLARTTGLWDQPEPLRVHAPEPGVHAIYDALALPGRRFLLALGESGVVMVEASGRVRHRYAVPAWRLVGADNGVVALAVARRERLTRVHHLDLVAHAIRDLGELDVDQHARRLSGLGWTVRRGQHVSVIDTGRSVRDLLWHLELPAPLRASGFFPASEVHLVGEGDRLQEWSFDSGRRRRRAAREHLLDPRLPVLAAEPSGLVQPHLQCLADGAVSLAFNQDGHRHALELGRIDPADCVLFQQQPQRVHLQPVHAGLWVALCCATVTRGYLVSLARAQTVMQVEWPADAELSLREQPDALVLHDTRGRVLAVELDTASVRLLSAH